MMRCQTLSFAAVLLLSAAFLKAQSPTLQGIVVNSQTGAPMPNTRVKLTGDRSDPLYTTTAQGRFHFVPETPGTYIVTVDRPGLAPVTTRIDLATGRITKKKSTALASRSAPASTASATALDSNLRVSVNIPITPGSIITGIVTDPNGQPPAFSWVEIYTRRALPNGDSRLEVVERANPDDRGEYRSPPLEPGTYYLALPYSRPPRFWDRSWHTTYYPHSAEISGAKPIELAAGQVSGASIDPFQTMGAPAPLTVAAGYFCIPITQGRIDRIDLQRAGYVDGGQWVPDGGKTLPVDFQILLTPAAVITGKVEDQDGVPVLRARVETLYYSYYDGIRKLERSRGASTDDKGEYRIANLPPGRYFLRVVPNKLAEWDARYTPRYYPSTIDLSRAEVIEVKAGEQHAGKDFRLTRMEGVTISGTVLFPAGMSGPLYLESTDALGMLVSANLGTNTSFAFTHIPPGTYRLRTLPTAVTPRFGTPAAEEQLEVGNADIGGIVLRPVPLVPVDISGKLTFREGAKAELVRVQVSANNPFYFHMDATPDNSGSFTVKGLLPGHYDVQVYHAGPDGNLNYGVNKSSVLLNNQEVLLTGFDVGLTSPGSLHITVASPVAHLSGKLLDPSGQPAAAHMLLVPVQAGAYLGMYTLSDGAFQLNLLNAGDYRVYVDPHPSIFTASYDPDYLKAHANDYPVLHVALGENPPVILHIPAM